MDNETIVLERIIDSILEKNEGDVKTSIADFFSYLKENEMIISVTRMGITDNLYSDNLYYIYCEVSYKDKRVCFLDLMEDCMNFWIDMVGDYSTEYINIPIDEQLKKFAWEHIFYCEYEYCTYSNRCRGGRRKTIFDKEFDNVCRRVVMNIPAMKTELLDFIKSLLEMRKTDILVDIKYNQYLDFG